MQVCEVQSDHDIFTTLTSTKELLAPMMFENVWDLVNAYLHTKRFTAKVFKG